ncbi:MAG TPA: hypothetical protein VHY37_06610 [Tepidisphaeraceae bacterium]|nr:hypothetical protein [Tepidisphaeraceae bacterium]
MRILLAGAIELIGLIHTPNGAENTCNRRIDLQGIGQYHVHWDSGISYRSMLWDPTGGWMASVAIPWDKIGGNPADGDTWGVQFVVR